MKRATLCIIVITMLIASCQEDETPDDDKGNSNLKSTVSFKVNGALISFSKDFDDNSNFPAFTVENSPANGLIVQFAFNDGYSVFQFSGQYLANSSDVFTDGEMVYSDLVAANYVSYSHDECGNDNFSFAVQKQNAGIDYMPELARFTGAFSGHLVWQQYDPDADTSCYGPEVQIGEGSFSVIGIGY